MEYRYLPIKNKTRTRISTKDGRVYQCRISCFKTFTPWIQVELPAEEWLMIQLIETQRSGLC